MRRAIETAPGDGKAILLEDDASGEYAVARWFAEANDGVGESGEPIKSQRRIGMQCRPRHGRAVLALLPSPRTRPGSQR